MISFQDIYLDEEFNTLLEEVRLFKSDIRIITNLQIGVKHPLKLLRRYISGNQDQWLEHCREFDPQESLKITRSDFAKCLKVWMKRESVLSLFIIIGFISSLSVKIPGLSCSKLGYR